MMDPNPLPNSETPQDIHPEQRQRHTERWVPGLILIGLGGFFLISNLTGFELHNWWAVFILIPAIGSFTRAYHRYRQSGTIDKHTRQALLGGVILSAVTAVFLFDLSWAVFGPVLLILFGLSLLASEFLP